MKSITPFLLLSTIVLFFITNNTLIAQTAPNTTPFCGIENVTTKAYQSNPQLKAKAQTRFQQLIYNAKANTSTQSLVDNIVPVVFHIITPCEDNFDFTKTTLEDILNEVNADFTAQNTDEYNATVDPTFYTDQANVGLTFRLAEIDPNGNPTDGITRSNSYYSNDGTNFEYDLKAIIQWNPSYYLNVWIVQNVATSGFAQYPWTAETYPNLDGIVMSYDYMGEDNINNRPHILTHEIGHWLGLLHTWGDFTVTGSCPDPNAPTYCDCDDLIQDTPNCLGFNSISCPSNLPNSCTDATNDRPDNIFNFMDYACELMFTNDQKTRMLQVISDGVADRDLCVTSDTDPNIFLANNPNNINAKLYLDHLVFTESLDMPGTIQEIATIELRDCAGCSFSNNINAEFTTAGLPANIQNGLQITPLTSTTAQLSFNMTLTDAAAHDVNADITNFSINFTANAINGINNTTDVFNNASIKGLKIDFIDNSTGLQSNNYEGADGYPTVENVTDGDFEAALIPHISDYVGFYHYQGGFYMYTASGLSMEAAVTGNGSYNVKRLANNESLNSQVYQPITGGAFGGANELVIYDANNYTDWLDETGFVGVRVTTFCGEVYYVWVRIQVSNSELALIDLVINTEDDGQLNAGQSPSCVPAGESTDFLFLDVVNINQINNTSGNNGGYQFFNLSTDLEEGVSYLLDCQGGFASPTTYDGEWRVYVDLDADGSYSDPGELRYIADQQISINANVVLLPPGILTGGSLNTTMMVIYSLYPLNSLCQDYQYGETEEYNVTLIAPDTGDCPTTENITTTFVNGEVLLFETSDWISSNATIEAGAALTYHAGNYIVLNNEFTVNAGAEFLADIQECTGEPVDTSCIITTPTLADLNQLPSSIFCDYAYGICYNHDGDNKEFEVLDVASGTTNSYFATDYFVLFPNLTIGADYRYRVRKQCGTTGAFGDWSPYKDFTTNICDGTVACIPVPVLSDLALLPEGVYCNYTYGYCYNHDGDNKEFELTDLSTNNKVSYFSTDYYIYMGNLTPNTNYQYRVRKQCGTEGVFGNWSVYQTFTTPACS